MTPHDKATTIPPERREAPAPIEHALTVPFSSIQQKLHLLLQLGQLLMENGAETKRILRDMQRTATYMGIEERNFHLHIMYTTLMLNINDADHSYTEFRKCTRHGVNMSTISAISKLTWRALSENYSLEEFQTNLDRIAKKPRAYPAWLTMLSAGFACGGLCKLFGGSWTDFFMTALAFLVRRFLTAYDCNTYATIAITSFVATMLAWATHFLTGTPSWYPMIACPLFIIPGIPLVNAVDDFLNNFIVAGVSRAMNTLLIMGSMTFGIFVAIRLDGIPDITGVNLQPDTIYFSQAVAAAIASLGFSIIFNVPKRLLWVVALGGTTTILLRNFAIIEMGFSQAAGSLIGAAVVGIVVLWAIHWFHTPNIVLTIPSTIPMIPGVLLFRLLFAFLNIHELDSNGFLSGMQSGIEAVIIIIAIAVGVAIPSLFMHRYLLKDKQQRIEALLARRYEEE